MNLDTKISNSRYISSTMLGAHWININRIDAYHSLWGSMELNSHILLPPFFSEMCTRMGNGFLDNRGSDINNIWI